jgi:hypothetical protein
MEGGNHAAGALNASPCRRVPSCLVRFPGPQPPALERPPRLSIRSAGRLRFASVVSSEPPRPVACWGARAASVPCPRRASHGRTTCAASPPVRRRGARARRADEVADDEGVAKRGVDEDGGADRQVQEREDALLAEGQGGPLRAGPERVGARYASRALASVRAKRASLRPRRSLSHGTNFERVGQRAAHARFRQAKREHGVLRTRTLGHRRHAGVRSRLIDRRLGTPTVQEAEAPSPHPLPSQSSQGGPGPTWHSRRAAPLPASVSAALATHAPRGATSSALSAHHSSGLDAHEDRYARDR